MFELFYPTTSNLAAFSWEEMSCTLHPPAGKVFGLRQLQGGSSFCQYSAERTLLFALQSTSLQGWHIHCKPSGKLLFTPLFISSSLRGSSGILPCNTCCSLLTQNSIPWFENKEPRWHNKICSAMQQKPITAQKHEDWKATTCDYLFWLFSEHNNWNVLACSNCGSFFLSPPFPSFPLLYHRMEMQLSRNPGKKEILEFLLNAEK